MRVPNCLKCEECRKLYGSLTEAEAQRGVGMDGDHILTTAKGDCSKAWLERVNK